MKTIAERIYTFMSGEVKTTDEIAAAFPEISRSSISGRLHENLGKKFERVGKGVFRPMRSEEIEAQRRREGVNYNEYERPLSYAEKELMKRQEFAPERIPEVRKEPMNDRALLESLKLMKGIIEQAINKMEA